QVRAPITGTVIALNAQPGKSVGQNNAPVAVVADLSRLEVEAAMTPAQAAYVHPGLDTAINFATVPNHPFVGKVRRITTQADPNSAKGVLKGAQYVALVTFKNNDGLVKPNAAADVSVKLGEVKNALAVPVQAVTSDNNGKQTVKVLENGQWRAVAVHTGISD